eukprot:12100.XXX_158365_158475_1 [CDS] Oithona nana genome sequencing.
MVIPLEESSWLIFLIVRFLRVKPLNMLLQVSFLRET